MDYKLVQRQAVLAVGYAMEAVPQDPEIPKMWQRVHANGDFGRLMAKSSNKENFGLCIMGKALPEGRFTYMIAVDLDPEQAPDADMVSYTVAGGEYAAFRCASMEQIRPTFTEIYERWLPASEYKFDESRNADFEYYYMDGQDVLCDVYVPVIKK